MTIPELKSLCYINTSPTSGRPSPNLTDSQWQQKFLLMKSTATPSTKKKMSTSESKESGTWNEETRGTYHGATNHQYYCSYINDILRTIRSGDKDFCYFTYQVADLLKYEMDRLMTKYVPDETGGYWEVWLEK